VRDGDAAVPKLLWDFLFKKGEELQYYWNTQKANRLFPSPKQTLSRNFVLMKRKQLELFVGIELEDLLMIEYEYAARMQCFND